MYRIQVIPTTYLYVVLYLSGGKNQLWLRCIIRRESKHPSTVGGNVSWKTSAEGNLAAVLKLQNYTYSFIQQFHLWESILQLHSHMCKMTKIQDYLIMQQYLNRKTGSNLNVIYVR